LGLGAAAQGLVGPSDGERDYVFALSTANRFLSAWQTRGEEAGLRLSSARLKRRFSEEGLRSWISGLSNPHNQAFEVGAGRLLLDGRYAFPVRLYTYYTDERLADRSAPRQVIVARGTPETWLVDELP
jgi:hypothetical protein